MCISMVCMHKITPLNIPRTILKRSLLKKCTDSTHGLSKLIWCRRDGTYSYLVVGVERFNDSLGGVFGRLQSIVASHRPTAVNQQHDVLGNRGRRLGVPRSKARVVSAALGRVGRRRENDRCALLCAEVLPLEDFQVVLVFPKCVMDILCVGDDDVCRCVAGCSHTRVVRYL